jgi:hypothetical protein
MSTQLIGFSIGGICKRFLVAPPSMIWPANLVTSALFNTLHAQDTTGTHGRSGMSRERFFVYVLIGYFIYSQFSFSALVTCFPYNPFHLRLFTHISFYGPLNLFLGLLDRSQQCQDQTDVWRHSRLGHGSPHLRLGSNYLQRLTPCRPMVGCC